MNPLTLYELNHIVREVLGTTMSETYWLAAELSEVHPRANGHCYLEFVEKAPSGNALVAKASGCIWRNVYQPLSLHFEKVTGQRLVAGLKVLVLVSVNFHELYGYSLVVHDIDPTYTLGDIAQRRQEILAQLADDGVLELNKELVLPHPLLRIAVISSATAAGYGDFRTQLEQSGFPFVTQLFPAVMQGEMVERSIIAALDRIADEPDRWEAVVIIRGGGAVSDLNGFDTYPLAAHVAQFPLPVLTGIGHERDDTVIDCVAHTRLKTPTAVAAFLIERRRAEVEQVESLAERLTKATQQGLHREHHRLEMAATQLRAAALLVGAAHNDRLTQLTYRLTAQTERRLAAARGTLTLLPERLRHAAARRLQQEHHRLQLAQRSVQLAGPERILAMGYSITTCGGRVVRQAQEVRPGEVLTTRLAVGSLQSTVTEISEDKC